MLKILTKHQFQNNAEFESDLPPENIPERSAPVEDSDTKFNKLLTQKKTPSKKVRYLCITYQMHSYSIFSNKLKISNLNDHSII